MSMPNRTLCAVLEEMRKCHDTRNYSYLPGLIEEVQSLGNRMEAGLWDQHEITDRRSEIKKLEKEVKILKEQKEELDAATVSKS